MFILRWTIKEYAIISFNWSANKLTTCRDELCNGVTEAVQLFVELVELLLDEVLDGQVSKLLTPQGWHRILCEF